MIASYIYIDIRKNKFCFQVMTKRDRLEEHGLDSDEMLRIVSEMCAYEGNERRKRAEFEVKYPDFVDRYPVLFKMACEPNFDVGRFKYMIGLRDDVLSRKTTLEDASKEVGQKMFDVYVKDKVQRS
jgi:hypothetical protein